MTLHKRHRRFLSMIGFAFAALAWLLQASPSHAGGGPENVFLLVNLTSQASKTVANHYISLRNIPASNVFYVEQDENKAMISSKDFKSQILLPAFKEIDKRGLSGQIDYLIYSCGFPWKVNFRSEFPDEKYTPIYQPYGSLTGSTYLWAFAREKRKEMFSFSTNNYCLPRPATIDPKSDPSTTRAFRGTYRWLPDGKRSDRLGIPYLLSTALGVSFGIGNSAEEIVQYLRIAKGADGTRPSGTVYYMKHGGPRSRPRHDLYPQAIRELKKAGVNALVLEGKFPNGKQDIVGLTVGVATFNFSNSKCRITPGALCDNLTSYGGVFQKNTQTSLTEFLVHGAAGASGTVIEPLSLPHKFPTPFLHVHYARGCSMAEAFYQSIYAPFQQIIVGDPLCQPWASFPIVSVDGIPSGKFTKGTISLVPSSVTKKDRNVIVYELFIDGIRRKRCRPGGMFQLDTTTLADGFHELRVVGIDDTPIETQGRWIANIEVNNQGEAVQLFLENRQQLAHAKLLTIRIASTRKKDVSLLHNGRELGVVPTGKEVVRISTKSLGSGPIVLQARAKGEKGTLSVPLRFELPVVSSK